VLLGTLTLAVNSCTKTQDELYLLLIKQTRGCPDVQQLARAWEFLAVLAACAPPHRDLQPLVSDFMHGVVHDPTTPPQALPHAHRAWTAFKRVVRLGARQTLPTVEEVSALRAGLSLSVVVFFLDDTFEELQYEAAMSVAEAAEAVAQVVGLQNHSTFALFEHRTLERSGDGDDRAGSGVATDDADGAGHDVILPLDESRYVADVLQDFKHLAAAPDGNGGITAVRLLFRKRLFREPDDGVSEPAFLTLSCTQALHDYQRSWYPVPEDDAAQLGALAAHIGGIGAADVEVCLELLVPHLLMPLRPRAKWQSDIEQRLTTVLGGNSTKDDSRAAVLRIIKALPYGLSAFFPATRVQDPVGLLPGRVLLGINRSGVHFFRPKPREYLHCAQLRDIMQFGSSSNAVFFKMRVAGQLHVFQFETPSGEEICLALQTHINDIMARRYQRQQARLSGVGAGVMPPATPPAAMPTSPSTGGDGDAARRLAEMGAALADAQRRLAEESAAKAAAQEELAMAKASLSLSATTASRDSDGAASSSSSSSAEGSGTAPSSRSAPPAAAAASKPGTARPGVAPAPVRKVGSASPTRVPASSRTAGAASPAAPSSTSSRPAAASSSAPSQQLKELQQQLASAQDKLAAAEKATVAACAERDALSAKVKSLEASGSGGAAMAQEIADLKAQLRARDADIAKYQAEVAKLTAALAAKSDECADLASQLGEIDDLRDQLAEVAHKDEQTNAIIARQRTALETLETKYRDEAALRRKYYNQLEEAKGKVRVFARIRPLSSKEKTEKQTLALAFPDEVTIEHPWKDRENKSYTFDAVFGPDATQEQVFEQVSYLVQSALDGYNVVVFAYGQTGSGKTFTISGSESDPGITPRALRDLTRLVTAASARASVTLHASMLELYQDTLVDLLQKEGGKGGQQSAAASAASRLDIKKDAKGWVTVTNLTQRECSSYDDLMAIVQEGTARRKVANTQMNTESSRSHQVFNVVISSTDSQTQAVTKGKLSFVDLAGSERVKKSGATGEQLKEAQAINLSLSALGNVISALAGDGQGHVPYRDHKLTMLLSDCLGGSAKTLMFVNASPSDGNLDETQSSLAYAQRVRTIKNDVTRNVATKEMEVLRKQIAFWRTKAGGAEGDDLEEIQDGRQAPAAAST